MATWVGHLFSQSATLRFFVKSFSCGVVLFFCVGLSTQIAHAQTPSNPCPAVGADTACGVIITVIPTGNKPCPPQGCASVIFTGQGPYDTIEDTLVGVVNNGTIPLTSLVLTSGAGGADIFGFDGDGICGLSPITGLPYVPVPAGCPFGTSGYEGPGTSFSNISADATTGTVTFNPPIPPASANHGVPGTAYFSLEEDITAATACSTIVNGSVPKPTPGGSPTIQTAFTPNSGYTIAQAAALCGFTNFDWQQLITAWPKPSPLIPVSGTPPTLFTPPSFLDPPSGGGYTYELTTGYPTGDFAYPYYLNPNLNPGQSGNPELLANEPGGTTLLFSDKPTDPCLYGGNSAGVKGCNGKNAPKIAKPLQFQTHLVGINSTGKATDLGIGFNWFSNFNGKSGGTGTSKNFSPIDPGSGTGGITVTNVSETTNYQYPKGVGVTAINGAQISSPPSSSELLTGNQISVTTSGFAYSRVTQGFEGSVQVTNESSTSIGGPFQIVLDSLPAGVSVQNTTTTFGGWPYITVSSAGVLAVGQSASANFGLLNPTAESINFSPVTYSGSFN